LLEASITISRIRTKFLRDGIRDPLGRMVDDSKTVYELPVDAEHRLIPRATCEKLVDLYL
jgi:hypothetical protein